MLHILILLVPPAFLTVSGNLHDNGGAPPHDRRPPYMQRCMWCDNNHHIQKDCADFTKALKNNVVYIWNGLIQNGSKTYENG